MAKNFGISQIKELLTKFRNRSEIPGAGAHNCQYRGKCLGSVYTTEQKNAIGDGTFYDLYVGDYWHFDNIAYDWEDDDGTIQHSTWSGNMRIADFDYYISSGSSQNIQIHHVIAVPDNLLFSCSMNDSPSTDGAYAGSKLRTKPSGLERARKLFISAFGNSSMLSHDLFLTNVVKEGKPFAGAWIDSFGVELMTEQQVYGGLAYDSGNPNGVDISDRCTIDCKQFNLFRYRPDMISNRLYFWLQNVVHEKCFALVGNRGNTSYTDARTSYGVRPAFVLRKPAD